MPRCSTFPATTRDLFALTEPERRHGLKLFILFFRREAFLPGDADSRTLHQRALEEGRFHQERVASNLSDLVFGRVFPDLARAIAGEAPDAPLGEVRDAALVVLYRLLFILYAEDRDLLPVRDERYDDYGLRDKVRGDVGRRKDRGDAFSETAARYWSAIDDLCRAVDAGDPSIGLPPYDGGLFDRESAPLLSRIRLGDRVMADIIDALSFEAGPEGRRYINYRNLSVQQLGSIYERLLEHEVARDGDEIVVRPNVFARKGSGSYYTPDELVGLILEETIGPLVRARLEAFATETEKLRKSRRRLRFRLTELKRLDPASRLLDLKVCDPAMGSGHFLVGFVDYLADRVIAAMAEAEGALEGYVSPLVEDIDTVRDTVLRNAGAQGWTIRPEQLDDRHVVRRMVLKRCVYGVDKNPMAVELAKVSLWLHTFTVGAPLGFLDHHLRCGDSLFGCWVRQGIDRAEEGGRLFLHEPLSWAMQATRSMQVVEMLSDAEIDEAHHSAGVFAAVREQTAPLDAFLSLVHGFEWLNATDKDDEAALQAFFTGAFGDPVDIAMGAGPVAGEAAGSERFAMLAERARELIARARQPGRGGAVPQLAGRLPGCLVGLGHSRAARRLRCGHRQSALGSDEAAAGGVVRRPPSRDRSRPARCGPEAHDPRASRGRRPAGRRLRACERAGGIRPSRGADRRRLPLAVPWRRESLLPVRGAGDGARGCRPEWSACSPLPASPPTRRLLPSFGRLRPKGACGRCTTSRTGKCSFPMSTRHSSSAYLSRTGEGAPIRRIARSICTAYRNWPTPSVASR